MVFLKHTHQLRAVLFYIVLKIHFCFMSLFGKEISFRKTSYVKYKRSIYVLAIDYFSKY